MYVDHFHCSWGRCQPESPQVGGLAIHRRAGGRSASVVVDGGAVAAELRRRRLGRRGLAARVEVATGTTWLPAHEDLSTVTPDLLVLAALSLARSTTTSQTYWSG